MPRLLLRLSLCLAVVIFALALTARALGGTQPPNPALRGFIEGCEDKPQPCWHGIVPGETSYDEAVARLRELGMIIDEAGPAIFPGAVAFESRQHESGVLWLDNQGRATSLQVNFVEPMQLMEAMTVVGPPVMVSYLDSDFFIFVEFMYQTDTYLPFHEFVDHDPWLGPTNTIESLAMHSEDYTPRFTWARFPWLGVRSTWRYCQEFKDTNRWRWEILCE